MGGKHLKKLRAERAKVHLKKKKILPKGQNITNTAFTVKKIVTIEQLKKVHENEPVSNWNVPLKDLLIRLTHYNFTSRLNALNGIKEVLTKYPEILNGPSLKNLICRVLELLTDEEHKVRTTAVELLSYIFDLIPLPSIMPFYDILSVHLGCVMTHRNSSVQWDTLKFIDVLIKYSPEALKHNFKSVAQNFIRIVKNYLFECHRGTGLSKGSSQNLVKAKTQVLMRFHQFLTTGLFSNVDEKLTTCSIANVNVLTSKKISLRNTCDLYKRIPDLSSLFKSSQNKEKTLTEFDAGEFQLLCSAVIPMLLDTWLEYSPEQVAFGCVISEGVGEYLSVLLKIIFLLYLKAVTLQVEDWFLMNYSSSFQKAFTSHFPYLPSVPTNKTESGNYSELSGKGWLQNLLVCYLSYSFKIVPKNSSVETKMENFLSNALTIKNPTESKLVLKLIEVVLNASKKKKTSILSKVVAAYSSTNSSEFKQGLSKILMKLILEEHEICRQKDHDIMTWMKSLPDHLCQSQISIQEIEIILKLINRPEGDCVLREVEFKAEEIIKNLADIKIEGVSQVEGQKMIANILYRCSSEILEKTFKNVGLDNRLHSEDLRNYIRDIFFYKFGKNLFLL